MSYRRAFLLAMASCLAAGDVVRADSSDDRRNHDQARRAFQQGQIRSLSDIMAELRPELGGEVIEVELKNKGWGYYYKFKVLAPNGRIGEISVDATNGKVIERE
jgi:uncharacterized membrane protein YkoI